MATVPFQGVWSPDTQFTGNAVYVLDGSGTVWLAADSTASGAGIYTSPPGGASFSLAATIPNVASPSLAFDPAIAIDAEGNLHIVGQVAGPGGITLKKFTYNTETATLSGPFPITTAGFVTSDYDIVALSNGNTYIVSCLLTGSTETIEGFEVNPIGGFVHNDFYLSQPFTSGSRYGSVSLWSPDGVTVEVYFCSEPKAFAFSDTVLTISQVTRFSPGNISTVNVLAMIPARYASGRLTVLGNGTERWIVQAMYTQAGSSLISNAIIGHLNPLGGTVTGYGSAGYGAGGFGGITSTAPPGTGYGYGGFGSGTYGGKVPQQWSFQVLSGTVAHSIIEPVLSISPNTVVLAYIDGNPNVFAQGGPVRIVDVNPVGWVLNPRTDFPYPAIANFLRGSKTLLPANMPWGFLGQQAATGVARFYTGYNAPPVAVISPAAEVCQRGVLYGFDASGSTDLNLNTLEFSWTYSDPTGQAVFSSSGSQASVLLPASIGPAAETISVSVAVTAVDINGNALHAPSTATATLTYPSIPVPVIAAMGSIPAERNSTVTLAPAITISPATTPTYLWTQTGGTVVPDLSPIDEATLTVATNGSAVVGETLSFQLTVNDGVNAPVSATFGIAVASRISTGETQVLARSVFGGKISQRNSAQTWTSPAASATVTGFTQAKRAPLVRESAIGLMGSYILIGKASVVVERNGVTYHVLTPNPADTILDAEHSFLDETILLTSAGQLLRMPPNPTGTDTDNAAAIIDISDVSTSGFTRFTATPPYSGKRVFLLSGPSGCLLLSVDTDFELDGSLFLSANGEHLYGASNVQWVRSVGVESLHRGILLIGTQDVNGTDFETQFNLANRTVVSIWDSSKLRNQNVTTGELLFAPIDSYSGYPLPPSLAIPPSGNGGATLVTRNANGTVSFTLAWTQSRPDLVSGYTVLLSPGVTFYPLLQIGSGSITAATISLPPGASYHFQVVANSLDGNSLPSNTVTVNL